MTQKSTRIRQKHEHDEGTWTDGEWELMSKCLCYAVVNNPFESHALLSLKTFIFHFYLDTGKGGCLFSST